MYAGGLPSCAQAHVGVLISLPVPTWVYVHAGTRPLVYMCAHVYRHYGLPQVHSNAGPTVSSLSLTLLTLRLQRLPWTETCGSHNPVAGVTKVTHCSPNMEELLSSVLVCVACVCVHMPVRRP